MWIQFLNIISRQKSNVIFFQNKERLERMQKVQLWKKEKKLGTRLIPIIESNISILSFALNSSIIYLFFYFLFVSFIPVRPTLSFDKTNIQRTTDSYSNASRIINKFMHRKHELYYMSL